MSKFAVGQRVRCVRCVALGDGEEPVLVGDCGVVVELDQLVAIADGDIYKVEWEVPRVGMLGPKGNRYTMMDSELEAA